MNKVGQQGHMKIIAAQASRLAALPQTLRHPVRIAAVAAVACCISLGGAVAQIASPQAPLRLKSDFLGYSFSVSPRVGYSDNINLAPDEFRDDQTILSNLFTANAIISTPRFTALFSGDLDFSYLVENEDFVVNQTIGAAGTATIVDNFLYLDIAGGSNRQLVGDNAAFSGNINAARGDRTTVSSYAASPYVYRQFADESAVELRYRYSQVFIDNEAGTASAFLNDSQAHEALASYESGRLFDRLQFIASAYGNLTDEDGQEITLPTGAFTTPDFSFDQGTLSLQGQYALNTKFALSGAVGYDTIETSTPEEFFDDNALSGIFWRAGFVSRPGRRTRVRLEYGRRFDDDFINADVQYEISQRFLFTAGANRTFQTRALANAEQINQFSRSTLDFADRLRDGGAGTPRDIIRAATQLGTGNGFSAQTLGVGPSNNAFVSLNGVFERTTVGLNVNYQNSDFGFRQFENITGTFAVTRALSRRLSAFGNAAYRFADTGFSAEDCIAFPEAFGFPPASILFDPVADCTAAAVGEGVSHTISGTVGLNYQLGARTSAFGQYTRTERFSPLELLEFSENAVTVGIVVDF